MKSLFGHVSESTAYLVNDYPYGGKRCRIRFWMESHPKKGFRFVSQTENPKTLQWNSPKKSTYMEYAGTLYLNEKGHCVWTGLGLYSKAEEFAEFTKNFPDFFSHYPDFGNTLYALSLAKMAYEKKSAEGKIVWTINGVPQPVTDSDKETAFAQLNKWTEVSNSIKELLHG